MKTFESFIAEELDLTVHKDRGNNTGSYNETFAGTNSANAFHHKVNTSGSKVIEHSVAHVPGLGKVHTIRYQGGMVKR